METLYASDKVVMSYDTATNTLITRWTMPESVDAELYKDIFFKYKDIILEKRPDKIFADGVNNRNTITPELQAWTNELLSEPYREIGLKKMAVLISADFYAALSVQQTIEEDTTAEYQTAFFEDEAKAFEWLNQ
ncbi:hypothetical protein [Rhodoflexus caldus]|uniref:hypothetical protein n=1 Tax=Rhodoflexus caldus TaxID=2891236 RepID=UPI002029CB29|nr:hypothetical protein [Rhodoflexus caldus]